MGETTPIDLRTRVWRSLQLTRLAVTGRQLSIPGISSSKLEPVQRLKPGAPDHTTPAGKGAKCSPPSSGDSGLAQEQQAETALAY